MRQFTFKKLTTKELSAIEDISMGLFKGLMDPFAASHISEGEVFESISPDTTEREYIEYVALEEFLKLAKKHADEVSKRIELVRRKKHSGFEKFKSVPRHSSEECGHTCPDITSDEFKELFHIYSSQ